MSYTVLVLCTGNIGRSPLAEAILRRRLADGLEVAESDLPGRGVHVISAGTQAPAARNPSARSITAAAAWRIDISTHQSTRVSAALIAGADSVFCMDSGQLSDLEKLGLQPAVGAELLDPSGSEIPDPRGHDDSFFAMVKDRIIDAVEARLPALLKEARESALPPG